MTGELPAARGPRGRRRLAVAALRVLAAAALAVTAYVHADLAGRYGPIRTRVLSEQQLFWAQAGLAAVLAAAVLLPLPRRPARAAAAGGALVGAASLAAILLYRYLDVGRLGPLPNLYEPAWFAEKTLSAYADAAAALGGAALWLALAGPGDGARGPGRPGGRGTGSVVP